MLFPYCMLFFVVQKISLQSFQPWVCVYVLVTVVISRECVWQVHAVVGSVCH